MLAQILFVWCPLYWTLYVFGVQWLRLLLQMVGNHTAGVCPNLLSLLIFSHVANSFFLLL